MPRLTTMTAERVGVQTAGAQHGVILLSVAQRRDSELAAMFPAQDDARLAQMYAELTGNTGLRLRALLQLTSTPAS